MTNSTSSRFDVYEAITNQIVSAIEAGPGQVQLPWHRKGFAIYRPVNVASKNAYRGVNTVALWAAADAQGFANGVWGTYRQWQDQGAQVRNGEKSSLVIRSEEQPSELQYLMRISYAVFCLKKKKYKKQNHLHNN